MLGVCACLLDWIVSFKVANQWEINSNPSKIHPHFHICLLLLPQRPFEALIKCAPWPPLIDQLLVLVFHNLYYISYLILPSIITTPSHHHFPREAEHPTNKAKSSSDSDCHHQSQVSKAIRSTGIYILTGTPALSAIHKKMILRVPWIHEQPFSSF